MKFKLVFDEKKSELKIHCLYSKDNNIVLPDNTEHPVFFPIPIEFKTEIEEYITNIIDIEHNDKVKEITKEIRNLQEQRSLYIKELRKIINPKIIEKCKEFADGNPEYFI
jgi:hypothetical protein